MHKEDEHAAFQAMLDEIEDSDEDIPNYSVGKPMNKPVERYGASADAKAADAKALDRERSKVDFKAAKQAQDIEAFGSYEQRSAVEANSEQLAITKRWLLKPCSPNERTPMRCFVERERSTLGLQTTYRLFAEAPDNSGGMSGGSGVGAQQPRFLMAARKKVSKQTSYYLVSLQMDPSDDRGSEHLVGKVRGNTIGKVNSACHIGALTRIFAPSSVHCFSLWMSLLLVKGFTHVVGSRYLLTDSGLAPGKTVAPSVLRRELGVVSFEFDSGGPSRIEAYIPHVSPSGLPAIWQPSEEQQGLEAAVMSGEGRLMTLRNKVPKWDEAHGGHVLNFNGRVTESSVKNFQLVCPQLEDSEEVVLQFGRVGKHRFTLDLRYPLSPFQAFGIAVGCLDNKIADRKGYEFLRRLTGSGAEAKDDGAGSGSSGVADALPSTQYLRDKIYRTFK
eukprot:gene35605-43181_t